MLTSLAYLLITGITFGYIFTKLKLPPLLGMLIAGMVVGPFGADMLSQPLLTVAPDLKEIALVIILLRAGLALNVGDLKKVGRPALLLCFVPAIFEIVAITLLAPPLLGITTLEAAMLGTVIAAVSPAIIVPRMLSLIESKIGTQRSIPQMIMAACSVDDVFVIILFSALLAMNQGEVISTTSLLQVPVSIVLGLLLGIAVGYAVSRFFMKVHLRDTIKLLIIISISFLMLEVEELVKSSVSMSGLLAIMAMGSTICIKYPLLAKRISPKFTKLWVGAEVILFTLVGSSVDLGYAMAAGFAVVALVLVAIIFRSIGTSLSVSTGNLSGKEKLFCTIAFVPKATVQAAIGSIPLAMGLECGNIVLTTAVVSILISAPLGAIGIDLSYRRLLGDGNKG